MRGSRLWMILSLSAMVACGGGSAKPPGSIGSRLVEEMAGSCVVCGIQVDSVGVLTEPYVGTRTISLLAASAADGDRIVIAPGADWYTLSVVDRELAHPSVRGREGEGPGEFRRI